MRVLILNNFPHNAIGGAEAYSYNVINLLIEKNYQIDELSIFKNDNTIYDKICETESVINCEKTRNWFLTLIKMKIKLIKLLNKNDYDIVISNTVAWPFIKKYKNRLIFIQHNEVPVILNKKVNFLRRIFFLGSSYNYSTDIVSYTKLTGQEMLNKNRKLKHAKFWDCLLFSDIHITKDKKINNDEKYITFIGRDNKVKRVDLICKLSNLINEKIRIISDTEDTNKFNKFPNILFLGKKTKEEIFDHILPTSKYIILLSEYEGLGFVFVEAFSCGIPIICRDSFLLANFLVNNGKNGILLSKKIDLIKWSTTINNRKYDFQQSEILDFYRKNFSYENFKSKWINIIDNNME